MRAERDRTASSAWDRLANEAAQWRLAPVAVGGLVVAPLVAQVLSVAWLLADRSAFFALSDEDGNLEWLQFLALAVSCALFLGVAWREWHRHARTMTALAVLAMLGCAFVAAEEISWGQRVLDIATPDALREVNVQGETNLHNLAGLELVVRGAQIGGASYAVLAPLAAMLVAPRFGRVDRLLVPPFATVGFFLPLAAYWLVRLPLVPSLAMTRFSEIPETTAYLGLALVAWLNLRRTAATGWDQHGDPHTTG